MKKQLKKNLSRFAVTTATVGTLLFGVRAFAADPPDENLTTLLKRINELEQQVKILHRNRELDQDAVVEKAKTTPLVTLSGDGLVVKTADSNFVAYVHGYGQVDGRFYPSDRNTANDTILLRRVRPILEGTVYDKFDYRLMLDFASGNGSSSTAGNNALLDDAYVNARFWKDAQFQVGKYKSPIGLERLKSTADLTFVETGFATQLTPNYDLGVMVHNDLFKSPYSYAIGVFNGATDGGSNDADTSDQGKDVVARFFTQPFMNHDIAPLRRLGFGVAGSVGSHQGTLASYKTPGQQTFFSYASGVTASGEQYRLDPQLFWYWGAFGLEGEYVLSSQRVASTVAGTAPIRRFNNTAWQLEASYFLTGEENTFKSSSLIRVAPLHPFSFTEGGWGAFELAVRVQQLSLDKDAFAKYATSTSAKEATAWGVGINWYLNRNVKLNLDYESTTFKGGSSATGSVTGREEHAILSQVQFAF